MASFNRGHGDFEPLDLAAVADYADLLGRRRKAIWPLGHRQNAGRRKICWRHHRTATDEAGLDLCVILADADNWILALVSGDPVGVSWFQTRIERDGNRLCNGPRPSTAQVYAVANIQHLKNQLQISFCARKLKRSLAAKLTTANWPNRLMSGVGDFERIAEMRIHEHDRYYKPVDIQRDPDVSAVLSPSQWVIMAHLNIAELVAKLQSRRKHPATAEIICSCLIEGAREATINARVIVDCRIAGDGCFS